MLTVALAITLASQAVTGPLERGDDLVEVEGRLAQSSRVNELHGARPPSSPEGGNGVALRQGIRSWMDAHSAPAPHWSPSYASPAPRRRGASHRDLYWGILLLDWISTEHCCGGGVREIEVWENGWGLRRMAETSPLPLMGSALGRAVTMSALAFGWSRLDRWLARRWPLGRAILRTAFKVYAVFQLNANFGVTRQMLGWEPSFGPYSLLPGSWHRNRWQ